jgi:molybdate transport system ATP-binding protein
MLPQDTKKIVTRCAAPLLILDKLSVRLRGKPVLTGIDWQIAVGEQWAILGPNGSGKTTLVKAVAGKLPTAEGRIRFTPPGGGDFAPTPAKYAIGFVSADLHRIVFERNAFADELLHFTGDDRRSFTASDFILDREENAGHHFSARAADLQRLSDRFGIRALLQKSVSALTTGEISKALILKALLHRPQLLILDEPFSGLDRRNKEEVARIIGDLIRTGLHLILITHHMDEIVPEISHVLLLTAEGVQKAGRRDEVLRSDLLQRIYRIPHDPLHRETKWIPPAGPGRRYRLEEGHANEVPDGTPLVEMRAVKVRHGRRLVLRHVDWIIRKGENWLVHGPEGAGKSSLLKLITGENLQSYANDIFLFGRKKGSGESVWDIKERLGWVSADLQFQYPANVNGSHVVCSGFFDSIGLYRAATAIQRRQAQNVISALGIDELSTKTFGLLSHGQKQMLLMARAIVKPPLLLLLDDPCDGLDVANRRKIMEIIDFIGCHTPTTVIYAANNDRDRLPCLTHRLYLDRGSATISLPAGADPHRALGH